MGGVWDDKDVREDTIFGLSTKSSQCKACMCKDPKNHVLNMLIANGHGPPNIHFEHMLRGCELCLGPPSVKDCG